MTIYRIHAYIISMNWSKCHIALGYNCHMMNIIQQVIDPMPTNFSILFLLSYYCYHHCYTCYKLLLSLLLLSKVSNYFATDHIAVDN